MGRATSSRRDRAHPGARIEGIDRRRGDLYGTVMTVVGIAAGAGVALVALIGLTRDS